MSQQWQPQQYDPQAHQQRLQQPHQQQQYPPPRRKRHIARNVLAGIGALIVIGAIASALKHPPASASSPNRPPVPAAAPAPAKPHLVASYTGSGQENTPRFTVTATWKLVYSFNCSAFGYSGNFIASEDGDLGAALTVNDTGMSKTASTWAYDDAGTHYLSIDSECAWKMKVYDEG